MSINKHFVTHVFLMMVIICLSNYLVQFPINLPVLRDYLTFGALTYPLAFLLTDLTNRSYGAKHARYVVYIGFVLAVVLSIWLATPRIAIASGTAFLTAQLLDITVFNWLRHRTWWQAPLCSSILGSIVDTYLFFGIAFIGVLDNWGQLAFGDLLFKFLFAAMMLIPFKFAAKRMQAV